MNAHHPFDVAMELAHGENGQYIGRTSAAYANMVGPFGGTTAAVMLKAALVHPDRIGEPVTLTVNYAAPIADGEFGIAATAVRTNRTTQHWTIELRQSDGVKATATAVFAVRRDTWSAQEVRMPEVPPAEAIKRADLASATEWVKQYDMRFVQGALSFDPADENGADSLTSVWLRDEPPRPLDFPSLTAICDAFFPRIFVRRRRRSAIGTVSLNVIFHADAALLARNGSNAVLGRARSSCFRNGFFDQGAEVYGADGTLLAVSTQAVYYKD